MEDLIKSNEMLIVLLVFLLNIIFTALRKKLTAILDAAMRKKSLHQKLDELIELQKKLNDELE